MHPAGESFLFDHEQGLRAAARERQLKTNTVARRRPRLLTRIKNFFQMLNHVRCIHIEVTFEYQETHLERFSA